MRAAVARTTAKPDTRQVLAGTYVAEQRSGEVYKVYNILSVGSPSKPSEASTKIRDIVAQQSFHAKRRFDRRVAGQYYEQAGCTVLPALATIDPLLHVEAESTAEDESKTKLKLPKLPLVGRCRHESLRSQEVCGRLYPNHRRPTQLGESPTPVPTDDEFREWLTIPTPRSERAMSPRPRFDSGYRSCSSRGSPPLRFGGAEDAIEPGPSNTPMWNLLLLRSTFDGDQVTAKEAADCLMRALDMEPKLAQQRVAQARRRVVAVVERFEDRSVAFKLRQELRNCGLHVQLAMDSGIPDGRDVGGKDVKARQGCPKGSAKHSYRELFEKSTHRDCACKVLPPLILTAAKGSQRARHRGILDRQWLCESSEKVVDVVPVDAVEALFDADLNASRTIKVFPNGVLNGTLRSARGRGKDGGSSSVTVGEATSELPRVGLDNTLTSALSDQVLIQTGTLLGAGTASVNVLEAVSLQSKITPLRREACQYTRIFVFGSLGNEHLPKGEKDKIFYESVGTKEKVHAFHQLWRKLDSDGSGRVDSQEFRAFAEQNLREKIEENAGLLPWLGPSEDIEKFSHKLCDKLAQLLFVKKASFNVEDMMRLIWPASTAADLKEMKRWCVYFSRTAQDKPKVKPPDVLKDEEFDGLRSVFFDIDSDHSGTLSMEELIAHGLIHEDEAIRFLQEWDMDEDGELSMMEFCQMMCPLGHRAHKNSTIGTRNDGTIITFDKHLNYWVEGVDEKTKRTHS